MKRIGIMGGTFNPIHHGHLLLANEARYKYSLDKVIFIPTGVAPHKNALTIADAHHRYEMVNMAIKDNKYFEVSNIETKKNTDTYSYDTLKEIATLKPDYRIFFITGADAITELGTWYKVSEIGELCDFIAATRSGINKEQLRQKLANVRMKFNVNIDIFEIPQIDISSTQIRTRIKEHRPIQYFLPENVIDYIEKNNLYRSNND